MAEGFTPGDSDDCAPELDYPPIPGLSIAAVIDHAGRVVHELRADEEPIYDTLLWSEIPDAAHELEGFGHHRAATALLLWLDVDRDDRHHPATTSPTRRSTSWSWTGNADGLGGRALPRRLPDLPLHLEQLPKVERLHREVQSGGGRSLPVSALGCLVGGAGFVHDAGSGLDDLAHAGLPVSPSVARATLAGMGATRWPGPSAPPPTGRT